MTTTSKHVQMHSPSLCRYYNHPITLLSVNTIFLFVKDGECDGNIRDGSFSSLRPAEAIKTRSTPNGTDGRTSTPCDGHGTQHDRGMVQSTPCLREHHLSETDAMPSSLVCKLVFNMISS